MLVGCWILLPLLSLRVFYADSRQKPRNVTDCTALLFQMLRTCDGKYSSWFAVGWFFNTLLNFLSRGYTK